MITSDDLQARLEHLFAAQAEAIEVPERRWSGLAEGAVPDARRRRSLRLGLIAAGLLAVLLGGLMALRPDGDQRIRTGPAANAPPASAARPGPRLVAETGQVSLTAEVLLIDVAEDRAGRKAFAATSPVAVSGDPGRFNEYTTLELIWHEHGVEMRLNIYFTSDGTEWWANEIRTYDGRAQGEWITYTGAFFRSKLGAPYRGDLDVTASDHGVTGRLRLQAVSLEVFRRPAACTAPTGPFAMEIPDIRVPLGISRGIRYEVLDTATCRVVPNDDIDYRWVVEDPAIATVVAERSIEPSGTIVTGRALGTTRLRMTAVRRSSGEVIAEDTAAVEVAPAESAAAADPVGGQPPTP